MCIGVPKNKKDIPLHQKDIPLYKLVLKLCCLIYYKFDSGDIENIVA